MIGADLRADNAKGTSGRTLIESALRYDRSRQGGSEPWIYEVELWRDASAQRSVPVPERYEPRVVGRFRVRIRP